MVCLDSSAVNQTAARISGWVDQPNFRGTLDIIWTCLFTIFVSTFTITCLNVPAPSDSQWRMMGRKIFWMGIAIAGPEFVLTYASAQWGTARESVKAFKELNFPGWTMKHGFFADMGGFLLIPRDSDPFPITSKHLCWLISNDCLPYPNVTPKEIWDKSKQDTIAKVVTTFQISYLVLQCIGRAAQGLVITTMELSTLAIVVCAIMTSYCWFRKPVNVITPIPLHSEFSMDEILAKAGKADYVWKQTPLDFVDNMEPSWALNVQTFMNMPVSPHERPLPRFGNDRLPDLKGPEKVVLFFSTLLYAAIHLFGWNYTFPTYIELILWRLSSMFLFGNTVAFWMFKTAASFHRKRRWHRLYWRVFDREKLAQDNVAREEARRQTALGTQRRKQLPLKWEFWSIFPLAVTYAAARGYLVVEIFLGLRALEPSAYMNVNWASFLPHV